jgi:hypothetical protein
MSQLYRIEVPAQDRFGSPKGLARFVVIVEIPDKLASALGANSPLLEIRVREVAIDATRLQRINDPDPNIGLRVWSTPAAVDANPADYGEANFEAGDGCRAWILESP